MQIDDIFLDNVRNELSKWSIPELIDEPDEFSRTQSVPFDTCLKFGCIGPERRIYGAVHQRFICKRACRLSRHARIIFSLAGG